MQAFLRAVGTGDINGLIAWLADDMVLHTDGGAKALAVPNLIYGPFASD